jgi:hypothetical protein
MGPRAGVDMVMKKKIPSRNLTPVVQLTATPCPTFCLYNEMYEDAFCPCGVLMHQPEPNSKS